MLKNIIAYAVTPGFKIDPELLKRRPARHCGALEQHANGFCAPRDDGELVYPVAGYQVICWETEDKILPSSVISDVVKSKIDQIEEEQGRKVGRKEAREIKEQTVDELLPKAFIQRRRTIAVLTDKYLLINTSSLARSHAFMECLGRALENLHFRPLFPSKSPFIMLTGWASVNEAPAGFTLDNELELRSITDGASKIKYIHHDIGGPAVSDYIAAGKVVTQMAMTYNDRLSFVINDRLHFKKLAFLDIVHEEIEANTQEADDLFDADITISIGECLKMIDAIIEAMGGQAKQESDLINQ